MGNQENLYPIDFCKFYDELLTQSESSMKAGRLTEINPPAPYCEEWENSPEFERKELIKWAISKEIDVPDWLIDNQPKEQIPKKKSTSAKKSNLTSNPDKSRKPRKKLKPLIRETTEFLLLIYEFFKKYEVNYIDEMPPPKAWGLIVSEQFTSSYIKSLPKIETGCIILNGGEKLDKPQFCEKYRSRFKPE